PPSRSNAHVFAYPGTTRSIAGRSSGTSLCPLSFLPQQRSPPWASSAQWLYGPAVRVWTPSSSGGGSVSPLESAPQQSTSSASLSAQACSSPTESALISAS